MRPTQQEIIELAREHATRYTNRHYPDKPVFTFTQDALQKVIELALERFGAGGGEPVAAVSIGKHPWNKGLAVVDLERPLRVGTKLYTAPQPAAPTDLRDEYLRGLEDAAKVCEYVATLYSEAARKHPEDSESRSRTFARSRAASQCVEEIRALLKGKQ